MSLPYTRIFSCLSAGLTECPSCHKLIDWGSNGKRTKRKPHQLQYNRAFSLLICPHCRKRYHIATLLYDAPRGQPVAPPDTRMSNRQREEARSYVDAMYANVGLRKGDLVNGYVGEGQECTCLRDGGWSRCPAHCGRGGEYVESKPKDEEEP